MGSRQWRGTERVARKAGRHRGSARSPFRRPAAVTAAGAPAASPSWWACPPPRPRAPQEGSRFEGTGASPAQGRAGTRPSRGRPPGPRWERAARAARRSRCSREWGRGTSRSEGPSGLQGTSALASRQEGIFPKRNRFIRTRVRWDSYATEKPQRGPGPQPRRRGPDVPRSAGRTPAPRPPHGRGPGAPLP